MSQKLLKAKKRRIVPSDTGRARTPCEPRKIVLVGTYAGDQLKEWPGYYPYPLSAEDKIDSEYCKKVNEIWLFKGTKEPRYFAAECLGVKTRDELKALGYPAKGKGHVERQVEDSAVVVLDSYDHLDREFTVRRHPDEIMRQITETGKLI